MVHFLNTLKRVSLKPATLTLTRLRCMCDRQSYKNHSRVHRSVPTISELDAVLTSPCWQNFRFRMHWHRSRIALRRQFRDQIQGGRLFKSCHAANNFSAKAGHLLLLARFMLELTMSAYSSWRSIKVTLRT